MLLCRFWQQIVSRKLFYQTISILFVRIFVQKHEFPVFLRQTLHVILEGISNFFPKRLKLVMTRLTKPDSISTFVSFMLVPQTLLLNSRGLNENCGACWKNHLIRHIPISSLSSPTLLGPLQAIKYLNQGFILEEPGLIRSH